jgi:hypothetical protein
VRVSSARRDLEDLGPQSIHTLEKAAIEARSML